MQNSCALLEVYMYKIWRRTDIIQMENTASDLSHITLISECTTVLKCCKAVVPNPMFAFLLRNTRYLHCVRPLKIISMKFSEKKEITLQLNFP